MCGKTIIAVAVIGILAFCCGVLFTQPSQGQQKDQKREGVVGRYNLVAVSKDRYSVIDTTDGHTWTKEHNPTTGAWSAWSDEGIPSQRK